MLPYVCRCFVSYRQGVFLFLFGRGRAGFGLVRGHSLLRISAWLVVHSKGKTTKKKQKKDIFFLIHLPWQRTFPQSHGDENHCLQVNDKEKTKRQKKKIKRKTEWTSLYHSSHRCSVTTLLSYFFNPMCFFFLFVCLFDCFFSRFTSQLVFYFETGNTKLPETAQFTQAPQSTTAFKLS